jgi:hypothetical protein
VSADKPTMAHNAHVIVLANDYAHKTVELSTNSGRSAISIGMRDRTGFDLTPATMTPAQARELAADLTARADEIAPPTVAPAPKWVNDPAFTDKRMIRDSLDNFVVRHMEQEFDLSDGLKSLRRLDNDSLLNTDQIIRLVQSAVRTYAKNNRAWSSL